MSRSDPPTVTLELVGDTPMTELSVYDATFGAITLPSSSGATKVEVPPGPYMVIFREGDFVTRTLIAAHEGTVRVAQPAPAALGSSIPIASTPTSREWHAHPAAAASAQRMHDLGGDSEIFVFIRDIGEPVWQPQRRELEYPSQANVGSHVLGLGIRLIDGATLDLEMQQDGTDDPSAHWCALTVGLPAGTYVLRMETSGSVQGMPITAFPGWTTQVFIRCAQRGSDPADRGPDLSTAAVTLTRRGEGFDANAPWLRTAEQARQALAAGRPMRGDEFDRMLRDKFQDPMLGLIGAHLLCRQAQPDLGLLDAVLGNLGALLGDARSPDLQALRLRRDLLTKRPVSGRYSFPEPPMLADGWTTVLTAATSDARVVPADSVTAAFARAASRAGPWLTARLAPEWRPPRGRIVLESLHGDEAQAARELLEDIRERLERPQIDAQVRAKAPTWSEWLDDLSRAVLVSLHPSADPGVRGFCERNHLELPRRTRKWSLSEVARELQVPASIAYQGIVQVHGAIARMAKEGGR